MKTISYRINHFDPFIIQGLPPIAYVSAGANPNTEPDSDPDQEQRAHSANSPGRPLPRGTGAFQQQQFGEWVKTVFFFYFSFK